MRLLRVACFHCTDVAPQSACGGDGKTVKFCKKSCTPSVPCEKEKACPPGTGMDDKSCIGRCGTEWRGT